MRTLACLLVAASVAGSSPGDAARMTGEVQRVVVNAGETLTTLAARFGVDARTIALDNGRPLDGRLARGEALSIDNRHLVPVAGRLQSIVVNVPQRMLFFTEEDGSIRGLPVAVGRATWRTPLGAFSILTAEENPTWDVPASILAEAARAGRTQPAHVPPGPANPLGRYWLGLSIGGVGIHGTNAPSSVYRVTTHGCMRLQEENIAWLFAHVGPGTTGHIVYEPVLFDVIGGQAYVEAHADVYRLGGDAMALVRQRAAAAGVTAAVDWPAVARVLAARAGVARMVSVSH